MSNVLNDHPHRCWICVHEEKKENWSRLGVLSLVVHWAELDWRTPLRFFLFLIQCIDSHQSMAYACFLRQSSSSSQDFLKVQRKLLKIDFIQQQTQNFARMNGFCSSYVVHTTYVVVHSQYWASSVFVEPWLKSPHHARKLCVDFANVHNHSKSFYPSALLFPIP